MIVIDQKKLLIKCVDILPEEHDEIFLKLEKEINKTDGVGLAAIQIGIPKRAFITKFNGEIIKFANGIIVSQSEDTRQSAEGCLSIPGKEFLVERPKIITYKDAINGEKQYDKQMAIIIQHEHDHCNGLTLLQTGKILNTNYNMGILR